MVQKIQCLKRVQRSGSPRQEVMMHCGAEPTKNQSKLKSERESGPDTLRKPTDHIPR